MHISCTNNHCFFNCVPFIKHCSSIALFTLITFSGRGPGEEEALQYLLHFQLVEKFHNTMNQAKQKESFCQYYDGKY